MISAGRGLPKRLRLLQTLSQMPPGMIATVQTVEGPVYYETRGDPPRLVRLLEGEGLQRRLRKQQAQQGPKQCAACGKEAVAPRKCPRCENVFYCSRKCHVRDLPQHKLVCGKTD